MNTRRKGRGLELQEAKVWAAAGWVVERDHPGRFVGPGRLVYRDFFDRYDFMAAWPAGGILCLVQVSTEGEGSHEEPLGFAPPLHDGKAVPVDVVLTAPLAGPWPAWRGVYEVYVYVRKLKGQGLVADRRWWPGTKDRIFRRTPIIYDRH